jgi:hypothetical protein
MSKYRKKPVEIEAVAFDGTNRDVIIRWIIAAGGEARLGNLDPLFHIVTPEGLMRVSVGDYAIQGVQGEFYTCKPDIFEATYDAVD